MLKTEHQGEMRIEPNYHQNDFINLNPQEPNNSQATPNYTPHITEHRSSMKKLYQNTTKKVPPPKQKKWRTQLILERSKTFNDKILK